MHLQLVAQASLIIETSDRVIWTDPWLFGTSFNDSWRLMPEPCFEENDYTRITDLWISHEHPDHFHIPTLKSIPAEFKERVTLWFQQNNSNKVVDALGKFGFKNIKRMPHRKWMNASDETEIYCAQIGQMDSCLAVRSQGKTILNINDCEVERNACRWLKKDLGKIDVVLNQFSMAGYSGEEDRGKHLMNAAQQIRRNVVENHHDLDADATIPIASFIYFCKPDNFYLNEYANSPAILKQDMDEAGCQLVVLYPGDRWEVGVPHDSTPALERYAELYENREKWPIDSLDSVTLDKCQDAFHQRVRHLHDKYPKLALGRLKPVVCKIPDLSKTVTFHIAQDRFEVMADDVEPDVVINSQPLDFMFRWPWGLQTLGVSARLILKKNAKNWRRHRILFSMDNAEIYLKPSKLITKRNLAWFFSRLPGSISQLTYQLRRMRPED